MLRTTPRRVERAPANSSFGADLGEAMLAEAAAALSDLLAALAVR